MQNFYLKQHFLSYSTLNNLFIPVKMRKKIKIASDKPVKEIEELVLADEIIVKWLDGKPVKKVIVVPK